MSTLDHFSPATAAWFNAEFEKPTPAQVGGWESIVSRSHTLIHEHDLAAELLSLGFSSGYKGFTLGVPNQTSRRPL